MTTNRDMLNVYGVVAAHFVDVLYNGLYIKAENAAAGNSAAVRDMYRQMVARFSSGLKQPKYCASVLDGMARVWNVVHPHKTQSQFMDLMMRQFLPVDAIETMTPSMIDDAMFDIVRRIASLSINYVFTPKMQTCIMEMRGDMNIIEDMKNEIASYCVVTRESIHTEWAMKQSGIDNTVTVDATSLTNASRQVRSLTAENNKLRSELERCAKALQATWMQLEEHKQQLKIQMSQSAQLEGILKIIQEKQIAVSAPAASVTRVAPAASPSVRMTASPAAAGTPSMSIRAQLMAGSSVTADRPAGAAQASPLRVPASASPLRVPVTAPAQASPLRVPAAQAAPYTTPSWTFTPMQDREHVSTPASTHASTHMSTPVSAPVSAPASTPARVSREEFVNAAIATPADASTLSVLDEESFISEMEREIDDIMVSTPVVATANVASPVVASVDTSDPWFDTADTILVA